MIVWFKECFKCSNKGTALHTGFATQLLEIVLEGVEWWGRYYIFCYSFSSVVLAENMLPTQV